MEFIRALGWSYFEAFWSNLTDYPQRLECHPTGFWELPFYCFSFFLTQKFANPERLATGVLADEYRQICHAFEYADRQNINIAAHFGTEFVPYCTSMR